MASTTTQSRFKWYKATIQNTVVELPTAVRQTYKSAANYWRVNWRTTGKTLERSIRIDGDQSIPALISALEQLTEWVKTHGMPKRLAETRTGGKKNLTLPVGVGGPDLKHGIPYLRVYLPRIGQSPLQKYVRILNGDLDTAIKKATEIRAQAAMNYQAANQKEVLAVRRKLKARIKQLKELSI